MDSDKAIWTYLGESAAHACPDANHWIAILNICLWDMPRSVKPSGVDPHTQKCLHAWLGAAGGILSHKPTKE